MSELNSRTTRWRHVTRLRGHGQRDQPDPEPDLELHLELQNAGGSSVPEPSSGPPWWWYVEVALVLVFGAVLLVIQLWADSRAEDRAIQLEERQQRAAQQAENLRFVRERSSMKRTVRPFQGLDLAEQDISALRIEYASFRDADLSSTHFLGTHLKGAKFVHTIAPDATFRRVDLRRANFFQGTWEGTSFEGVNLAEAKFSKLSLRGVTLERVDLSGTDLLNTTGLSEDAVHLLCFSGETDWPDGFEEPGPSHQDDCRPTVAPR